MTCLAKLCFGLLFFVYLTGMAAAQDPAAGIQLFSTSRFGIDLASSNVYTRLPVREKIGFSYGLSQNSRAYQSCLPLGGACTWNINGQLTGHLRGSVWYNYGKKYTITCGTHNNDTVWENFYIVDDTGASFNTLNPAIDQYGCINTTSFGGNGFRGYALLLQNGLNATIYDKHGNTLTPNSWGEPFLGTISDADGNRITATSTDSGQTITYTDPLDQTQPALTSFEGNNGFNTGSNTYSYYDANGTLQQYQVLQQSYSLATVFQCKALDFNGNLAVYLPYQVNIPGGGTYQFQYEPTPGYSGSGSYGPYTTGRVAKITFPTGGSITYTYGGGYNNNGINCNSNVVPTMTVTVNDNNGNSSQWVYANSNNSGNPGPFTVTETDPAGDTITHYFYGESETERVINDVKLGVLSTVYTCYDQNYNSQSACVSAAPTGSTIQTDAYTQLGTSALSLVETQFDGYGNTTAVKKYDYGATFPPSGVPVAETDTTYANVSGVTCGSVPTYTYDRPCTITKYSGGTVVAQIKYTYTGGHPTQTSSLVGGALYLNSYATYNTNGTINNSTDVNNAITTYGYTGTGGCNSLLPTSVNEPLNVSRSMMWDCNGGVRVMSTDDNSNPTTYKYNDPLWRLTEVDLPDGGQRTTTYNPTSNPPNVVEQELITPTITKRTQMNLDGLGRLVDTLAYDPEGTAHSVITYDILGRVSAHYNPTRCNPPTTNCGESTWGPTAYTYDAMNRGTLVTEPDNSKITSTYTNNCMTVTDEAGKVRSSCNDGLGQMTQVIEDPSVSNYETDYQYDGVGNVLSVTQKGGSSSSSNWRMRNFQYDSISRLTSATNPESGTTKYVYDVDTNCPPPNSFSGLLVSKTDARGVRTCMQYDARKRVTSMTYNDGKTPAVMFGYDGTALSGCSPAPPTLTDSNPKGNRTAMCDGSGATSWSHDQVDRVAKETRTIIGSTNITKSITYAPYNLDGSIASITYPSGRIVTYGTNASGRPVSMGDTANGINYVTAATYAPQGALSSINEGSSIFGGLSYNNRLQPLQIYYGTVAPPNLTGTACPSQVGSVMHRVYSFNPGSDNGNVMNFVDCQHTDRTENFDYDSLGRIKDAYTTGSGTTTSNWGEVYTIDSWGNLTNISLYPGKHNSETLSQAAMTSNQLTGFSYDSAGDLTQNGSTGYTYDGESRIAGSSGYTYVYDGDGKRTVKCSGTFPTCASGTLYWRGNASDALAEFTFAGAASEEYLFFSGRRLARRDGTGNTTHFYFTDHLGSTDEITSSTGTNQKISAYYPYGGEISVYGTSFANTYKFTGKEQDAESVLNNFEARYDASSLGRFMTPDPANFGAHPSGPQTWNAYSYAANNPLDAVDPSGLDCIFIGDTTSFWVRFSLQRGDCPKGADGIYVPGTVDLSSLTYNGKTGEVGYSFSSTDDSGGAGVIAVGPPPPPDISPFGLAVVQSIGARVPAIYKGFAIFEGGSLLVGATGGVACYYLCNEAALTTTLAGENGLDLLSNRAINQAIGDGQRELLKEFFQSGEVPESLTQRTLQLYKEVAQRAIAAGKDQLGVQAERLQMINNALE